LSGPWIGPLLWRASLRHLGRHPWQIGLAVLGVALGVAVVVAVDLATASATRAFTLATEAVTGRATHQVTGGPTGLPDDAYARLVLAGIGPAAPVVEDYVSATSPDGERRLLHLLGVDPFSEAPFRPYLSGLGTGEGGTAIDLGPLLTRPGAGLLPAGTARELGVAAGGTLAVTLGGKASRKIEVAVVGLLEPRDERTRRALADLLVVDIATAQELLGRTGGAGAAGSDTGRIDRIDLLLPEGAPGSDESERLLARARAVLPPGAEIQPAAARAESNQEMTRAFRLNLTALSLLALVCGVFLIYNTITFSVVQRRTLLGTLRALGVTRGQVFGLVLGEAAAVAVAGTVLGLLAGILLGQGLVRLVTQTLNDLYFVVAVRGVAIAPSSLLKGAAVGLAATLLAALAPALEATAAPPRAVLSRSALEARFRRALPLAGGLGAGLLALGALLLALPGGLLPAFAGLFGVILGFALLAPAATVLLARLLRAPMGALFGVLGRMAAGGVVATLSRTAVAVAALVIAVSVTVGVGVMIRSFRGTVDRWLEGSLRADLYVSAPSRGGGFTGGVTLDPNLAARAAALPGVARVQGIRRAELRGGPGGQTRIVAIDFQSQAQIQSHGVELQQGDPDEAWPAVLAGRAVLISEPLSRRRRLAVGDHLDLRTARGPRRFRIAGIYTDYASDQGLVMMNRPVYAALWNDPGLSGFSLTLDPGADPDAVLAALRRNLAQAGAPAVSIEPNRALKAGAMAVFDRTFRVTGVLRLLAGLVAFIGVLAALLALQLERARELGVLRANGLTPAQVWKLVTAQTGLLGLAAGLLSLPVGLTLAAVMIYVINRRSFGWTIQMEVPPQVLAEAVLLALAAALLAGLYPAWKMARTSPALALREE
jgi:putative ABC transport system permease protein